MEIPGRISPKRQRTSDILIPDDDGVCRGTPDSSCPKNRLDTESENDELYKVQPTPIRMGIVRQSIANFTRAAVPAPIQGKIEQSSVPSLIAAKAKAPGLPPAMAKKGAPPLPASAQSQCSSNLTQLRPLFWTTFPPPTDRACIWDDVDVSVTGISDLVKQAESRLVSLFAYKRDAPPPKRSVENTPAKANESVSKNMAPSSSIIMNGKRIMKVLDDRKTQNLSIAFRRFPEPEALMEAIVSVDTSKLSGDQVALLLQEFPSPDVCAEIERVESSHPEEDDHLFEWDRPEQYLLVLACIHNCRHILSVWSFAVNHLNKIDGDCGDESLMNLSGGGSCVRQQISDFIAACDCVCNSTCLRVFLATIRQVGNRMNANSARGNARGVSIESILQFDDLKSSGSGSASLFSVVVDLWLSKNRDNYSELQNQFMKVKKLRIPSIQEIEIEISRQSEISRKAANSLKKYYEELEDESSVLIADKLKALSDPVMKQIRGNADLLQKAKASWNKCITYFCVKGDSPLTKNSNDFFDHWKKVLKMIEKYAPGK